jgi:hypothetical protein
MHTERMQMSSNIMINIFCSVSCIIVSFGGDDGDPLPPGPCAEPRTHLHQREKKSSRVSRRKNTLYWTYSSDHHRLGRQGRQGIYFAVQLRALFYECVEHEWPPERTRRD